MKFIIIIILLVFPTLTFAQWNKQSIALIKNESQKYQHLKNPEVSTMWGGFLRFWRMNSFKGKEIKIQTKKFKSGSLPIYLSKVNHKAPLIVLLPGIFGRYNGQITPKNIAELELLNYHLVVPPNFLAPEYIENSPLYDTDPSKFDIEVVMEVLKKTIKIIGEENISKIHLIGESLGTLVASGVYAIDSQKASPLLKNGSISLLWPPVRVDNSLKNFDTRITKSETYHTECFYIYHLLPDLIYHFLLQERPSGFSTNFQKCVGAFLYQKAFMRTAKKSFETFKDQIDKKELNSIVPKNFSDFFKYYQPIFYQMLEAKDPRNKLSFWLEKGIKNNPIPIRIITSTDDFINDGSNWDKFKQEVKLKENQFIFMNWGGHSGPLALDIWKDIFRIELN